MRSLYNPWCWTSPHAGLRVTTGLYGHALVAAAVEVVLGARLGHERAITNRLVRHCA